MYMTSAVIQTALSSFVFGLIFSGSLYSGGFSPYSCLLIGSCYVLISELPLSSHFSIIFKLT